MKYEQETRVSCKSESEKRIWISQAERNICRFLKNSAFCSCVAIGFNLFLHQILKPARHLVQMIPVSVARPSPQPPHADLTSHPAVLITHNIVAPSGHVYLSSRHRAIGQACIIIARSMTAHIWHIPPSDSNGRGVNMFLEPNCCSQRISSYQVKSDMCGLITYVKTGNMGV